jgi:hypothetical protein
VSGDPSLQIDSRFGCSFFYRRERRERRDLRVIPAHAGIHTCGSETWIPACAGMTNRFSSVFSVFSVVENEQHR